MEINGLMKLTLLDYPGKTACTVFFGGCNFRCPFCHNASLVRGMGERISEEEFFAFLKKRQGLIDGVAITGGEPLLQRDIESFAGKIKELDFLVKLDTNGSFPERLEGMVASGLCDYVAMDIKSSPEGYSRAAGTNVDIKKIQKSVDLLMSGRVDHEFRTTVAKGAVLPSDMDGIGKWIQGAPKYYLQGFVDSGDILGNGVGAYSKEEMEEMLRIVQKYVPNAALRGVN
ncbi:MAG: anaerobic ribonucleoside-triphosphate reductase activating protein [Ruminococcaceae bacterium]|nr:anaerobic ribonucleoside-triphosphate reductase activating protein [Oscillospiraceae bacterium]